MEVLANSYTSQLSILKGERKAMPPKGVKLLHRMFEENLIKIHSLSRIALNYVDEKSKETKVSYNKLNVKANQMAYKILQLVNGKEPNQDGDYIIAVCMEPSANLIITFLAILKTGAAYFPLNVNFQVNRTMMLLNESKPILVIHDETYKNVNAFGNISFISFTKLSNDSEGFSSSNILKKQTLSKEQNDTAIILYASGSTTILKGARIPHVNIINRLKWQYCTFPYSKTEENLLFKTALTFVDSVPEIWGPLLNGLCLVIIAPSFNQDPAKLVQILEHFKIERIVLVPTLLSNILMYLSMYENPHMLQNLVLWVSSGEPLPIKLVQHFFDYFHYEENNQHRLCNFYGTTEVMGDVTYFVCESWKQLKSLLSVPIGKPIDNTIIYLLDSDYRPVRNDQVGEIFVSGLNLAKGYVKKREQDRFLENPFSFDQEHGRIYRTGDIASVDNGILYYEGRVDSQIKIRGNRIDTKEVEHFLSIVEGVDKCFVVAYHPGEMDQTLLGFVTLKEDCSIKSGFEVEAALRPNLPRFSWPHVVILKTLPFLFNGKVDRETLLKIYENSQRSEPTGEEIEYDYTGVPLHDLDMAKDLFETIGQMLGRKNNLTLSMDSNFFDLGGDSMNTILTIALLQNKGYELNITSFIAADNLGEILAHISDGCNKQDTKTIIQGLSRYCNLEMRVVPLKSEHKTETIDIMSAFLVEKGALVQFFRPQLQVSDTGELLDMIWDDLLEKDLSFLVKDKGNRTVGVSLSFDARHEPVLTSTSRLKAIFDLLETMETPIKDILPGGQNQILHSFLIGTHPELTSKENISVILYIENEIVELAKSKNFTGIFTTNASPLMQQIYTQVYAYQSMKEFRVNEYVDNGGTKPFNEAPDSMRVIVYWKELHYD